MSPRNPFALYHHTVRHQALRRRTDRYVITTAVLPSDQPVMAAMPLTTIAQQLPLRWMMWCLWLIMGLLTVRLIQLQVVDNGEYRDRAESNRISGRVIKAMRGIMTDRNGVPLVSNSVFFTVEVDAMALGARNSDDLLEPATTMAEALGVPTLTMLTALTTSLDTGRRTMAIDQVPTKQASRWMVALQGQPGVSVIEHATRSYQFGEALGSVLGYTTKLTAEDLEQPTDHPYALDDQIGRTGIEGWYESQLRGTDGSEQYEINGQGGVQTAFKHVEPLPGHNLQLAIDADLQKNLHQQLGQTVDGFGLPGGAAVALNPRTGAVLALVSYPAVDNNLFISGLSTDDYARLLEDDRKPLFQRAVAGAFPSGSTFKPVVAAGALEEGIITEQFTVNSTGGLEVNGQRFNDWKAGGHGITNVTRGLAESVNTFFYIIGGGNNDDFEGLGAERIGIYAKRFGLSQLTGIDLPGEVPGFIPSKGWKEEVKNEPWYLGDTYNFAIGQGDVLVTPLQVANYTAAIANGGTLYQPHLLQKIVDQQGAVLETIQPTILNKQVVSKKALNIVRQGMREAVQYGSARALNTLPVTAAAKTGTAQFGDQGKTHAWITVYAPAEDPEIVLTVLVEAGGEGSERALPIAQAALEDYFSR